MFDFYQVPQTPALDRHLELIQREVSGLTGERKLQARAVEMRIEKLLATPAGTVPQKRLLQSAILRDVDELHELATDGITGEQILPQTEEAALVRLYMQTAALHSILERKLTREKEIKNSESV